MASALHNNVNCEYALQTNRLRVLEELATELATSGFLGDLKLFTCASIVRGSRGGGRTELSQAIDTLAYAVLEYVLRFVHAVRSSAPLHCLVQHGTKSRT